MRGDRPTGSHLTTIYCDEAGNTGANLLDPEQPAFVLASNDFSHDEAQSLLAYVRTGQGGEPKFSTLRRRREGVARVIRLLADPRLNSERVRISVFHKRYLVIGKMVDLVMENLMHDEGIDLYERGANVATANLLYFCLPVFCDPAAVDRFLASFVDLIRQGPAAHKALFYAAGAELMASCRHDRFKGDLLCFTEPALFDRWWRDFGSLSLDPAIPSLFWLIAEWGERKLDRFDVLHDRSKPVLASQEDFESMMAADGEASALIGTDRRKMRFPLRAKSLSQGDSSEYPQLQVADLCAGAINHFYKLHFAGQMDELAEAVESLGCLDWGSNFVLPQPHVTPEALGTTGVDGVNSVEAMTRYLADKAGHA